MAQSHNTESPRNTRAIHSLLCASYRPWLSRSDGASVTGVMRPRIVSGSHAARPLPSGTCCRGPHATTKRVGLTSGSTGSVGSSSVPAATASSVTACCTMSASPLHGAGPGRTMRPSRSDRANRPIHAAASSASTLLPRTSTRLVAGPSICAKAVAPRPDSPLHPSKLNCRSAGKAVTEATSPSSLLSSLLEKEQPPIAPISGALRTAKGAAADCAAP